MRPLWTRIPFLIPCHERRPLWKPSETLTPQLCTDVLTCALIHRCIHSTTCTARPSLSESVEPCPESAYPESQGHLLPPVHTA